ncbi:MAG: carbohydrate ABC transporter permease [Litorilinea sp.]
MTSAAGSFSKDPSTRARGSTFLQKFGTYVLLISGSIIFTFPFLWMMRTSLLPPELMHVSPPVWIPWPPRWANYSEMWTEGYFGFWIWNSTVVTVLSVLGETITSTVVAYGFSRTHFPGRNQLFIAVLATLMIPFHVLLVPQFVMFNALGWINTLYPLWVPALFGGPFYIFILRQFMLGLPKELDEAAEIDGATRWIILWRIIVPLAKPAIATVAAFAFINNWNDFIRPLIFVLTPENQTLAVGIRWFTTRYDTYFHWLMAAAVISIMPIIIIFFFTQKQFMRGIALTGLKG